MVRKTIKEARANLEAALPYIPERYKKGVLKADWYTPASSDTAEKNFADAMSKVIAEKRRQKAIKALGGNKPWQDGAVNKGAPIIADRIRLALDEYERTFGPMLDEVNKLADTLPPKTLDFMANINNRLVPIVKKWKEVSGKL